MTISTKESSMMKVAGKMIILNVQYLGVEEL
jgi:hypothetical protein